MGTTGTSRITSRSGTRSRISASRSASTRPPARPLRRWATTSRSSAAGTSAFAASTPSRSRTCSRWDHSCVEACSPAFRAGQDQVDGGTKNTGGMSMAVETKSALNRFIAKTRDLFAEEPDLDKRWELLRPVLAELLADPEVTVAAEHWPDCVAKDGR